MDREQIDNWCEKGMLGLLMGLLVFAPASFGAVRPTEWLVVEFGILAIALLWMVRLAVKERFRFLMPPTCWALLVFVAYAAWRSHTADIQFSAWREFMQVAFLALLIFALVNNLHGQTELRLIAFTLVGVATLISMYAIYQWLSGSTRVLGVNVPESYTHRASGTYICPNHFAGFVEMCLPLALALAVSGRFGAVTRIVLVYAAVVMCVGIASSGSRGGWMAASISLLLFLAVLARERTYRIGAIALALLLVGGGTWLYTRALDTRVKNTFLSGHEKESRLRIWGSAWKVWKTSPWTGVGPDHFDHRYRAFRDPVDKTQSRPGRAHNDYLNTLVDYGAAGLALVLLPVLAAAWGAVRSWPHLKRSTEEVQQGNRSALVLGSGCGLVAILAHSFFDFNLHVPANALTATVLFAILTAHSRFATGRFWISARLPLRLAGIVILAGAVVAAGAQSVTRARAQYWLRRADKAVDASPEQIAALTRAAALEPSNHDTIYALAERHRVIAFGGRDNYAESAREAMKWFERGMKLNRWDPFAPMRYGMCLDWLDKHDEALPWFQQALEVDPNNFITRGMMAWHHFQKGDFIAAREWNEKSVMMNWTSNPQALAYREIIQRAIEEEARKKLPPNP
jgi:O-antigen ligase